MIQLILLKVATPPEFNIFNQWKKDQLVGMPWHANDRYWSGCPWLPDVPRCSQQLSYGCYDCTWISRRLFTWSMLSKWFFMPQTHPTGHHWTKPLQSPCQAPWLRPISWDIWDRHIWWPHVSLTWSIGPGDAPMRTGIVLWISPNFSQLVSLCQFCEATERVSQAKFQLAAQTSCFVRPSQECRRAKSGPSTPLRRCLRPFLKWASASPEEIWVNSQGGTSSFHLVWRCVETDRNEMKRIKKKLDESMNIQKMDPVGLPNLPIFPEAWISQEGKK